MSVTESGTSYSDSYSDSGDNFANGKETLMGSKPRRNFDSVLSVLLLNCAMAGIQFTFAIMSTVLTPYNDFLEMSESEKTAIAVIGPVCGFIIQPIFGSWSDNCHSRFGRRRIFMLGGVLFIVASLAFIGYGYVGENEGVAKGLAIAGMILMNVSINVMLCPARAIVSDLVSSEAQNKGQIYAALMMGASFTICNLIVYGLSYITVDYDINKYKELCTQENPPWNRATLTMVICSIGIAVVLVAQIPTMLFGKEVPLKKSAEKVKEDFIFVKMAKQIRYMPNIIARVCIVFFGSWAGYYPFQMFCSDIYGLQLGSLANAMGAIVTFLVSIFLDRIVKKIGERTTYKISQGIGAIAMIGMLFPFLYINYWREEPENTSVDGCNVTQERTEIWVQVVVCILVGLVGINNAVMNSVPFGIVGKCGGEAKGLYMGILNCCCVLAQALSILIDVIWTAIFPTPSSPAPADDGTRTAGSFVAKLVMDALSVVLGDGQDDSGSEPDSDYRKQVMLSKLGHVVVCAIFSVVAFFLCFILRNPNEVEAESQKLTAAEGETSTESEY